MRRFSTMLVCSVELQSNALRFPREHNFNMIISDFISFKVYRLVKVIILCGEYIQTTSTTASSILPGHRPIITYLYNILNLPTQGLIIRQIG